MEFLQRVPTWVWIAGAAVVAYFFLSRKSSSAGGPTTTGGGGSVTTGNTRIQKGAISISVMQNGQGTDQDQPSPNPPDMTKQIVVPKDETLAALAKYLHWSDKTLSEVEEMNAVGGQELTPASKLTKGQTIIRPIESA